MKNILLMDELMDLVERRRKSMHKHIHYFGSDFCGADLSGLSLSFLSLASVKLDGANLTDTHFYQVDLNGASFKGAKLEGARFNCVSAISASFSEVQAQNARWDQSTLAGANFSGAELLHSVIRNSSLDSACFNHANLTRSSLAYSNCSTAIFCNALLDSVITVGASFTNADFSSAHQFFSCRDIIVELLRREIHDDFKLAQLVGAVMLKRSWCYSEWVRFLDSQPHYQQKFFEVFQKYPKSGVIEAFQDAQKIFYVEKASNQVSK